MDRDFVLVERLPAASRSIPRPVSPLGTTVEMKSSFAVSLPAKNTSLSVDSLVQISGPLAGWRGTCRRGRSNYWPIRSRAAVFAFVSSTALRRKRPELSSILILLATGPPTGVLLAAPVGTAIGGRCASLFSAHGRRGLFVFRCAVAVGAGS